MRKITFIYIAVLMISGCSGLRKASRSVPGQSGEKAGTVSIKDVALQNLTSTGFFIPKAEVEINSGRDNQRFLASVKFDPEGKYLISIRSRAGIEAARIYIDRDTVLGNDRINKVLYFGKPGILSGKYGVPFDLLPVVFGDLVGENMNDDINRCGSGIFETEQVVRGNSMIYRIDCGRRKIISAENEFSQHSSVTEIEYSNFIDTDGISVPSNIRLNHVWSGTSITINIDRIERPWAGSVELIPGNRYELIELK